MQRTTTDPIHEKMSKIIENAFKKNVFSACSVGYFRQDEKGTPSHLAHYGLAGEAQKLSMVDEATVFDLASLTKPLCTALCMLALMEQKKINGDDTLGDYFTLRGRQQQKITIMDLLNHCSGLPAHRPYYKKLLGLAEDQRLEAVIDWILAENLLYEPGSAHLYSDLGFILLGKIIEKAAGTTLDKYWQEVIVQPLHLDGDLFFAAQAKNNNGLYAGTGECNWSKKSLYGVVNDDNCRALGGVAGHAGVFGTARAVLSLGTHIILQYQQKESHPAYSGQTLRQALDNKQGRWRFGFDTPSGAVSSSGRYFSELSIGHLGFTGTSFWLDLQRGIGIVLLTNRVGSGADLTAIKRLRPLVHDVIMAGLV